VEGFLFRIQQLTYKIVYTCIYVISSEEDTTENMKHLSAPLPLEILRIEINSCRFQFWGMPPQKINEPWTLNVGLRKRISFSTIRNKHKPSRDMLACVIKQLP